MALVQELSRLRHSYSTDWVSGANPVKPPNLVEAPEVTPEPRERIEPDVVSDEVDESEDDESTLGAVRFHELMHAE